MILRIPLLFEGSKASKNLYALFDSGATYSCINGDKAEELEPFAGKGNIRKETNNKIKLSFYIDGIRLYDEFLIVSGLEERVLIGTNTFRKWNIKYDSNVNEFFLLPKLPKLIPL